MYLKVEDIKKVKKLKKVEKVEKKQKVPALTPALYSCNHSKIMSFAQCPVQTYMKIRSIQAVQLLLARLDLIMELKQMSVLLSPTVLSRKNDNINH